MIEFIKLITINDAEKLEMFFDWIPFIDEFYATLILILFFILIIYSRLKNKYYLNLNLKWYAVVCGSFITLIYALSQFYIIFIIFQIANPALKYVSNSSLLMLYEAFTHYNVLNITDITIKALLAIFIFIWLLFYKNFIDNRYTNKTQGEYEIIILYLFITYILLKIPSTTSLLEFVILLESQNLALCILCAYSADGNNLSRIEASLKLYITGAVSSGFLVLGCGLIYGCTGAIDLNEIASILKSREFEQLTNCLSTNFLPEFITNIENSNLMENKIYFTTLTNTEQKTMLALVAGILFFFISLAFKIGQVPFHLWVSDVYTGGNMIFVSYLAIFPKMAVGYFFTKVVIYYFSSNILLLKLLCLSGFLTIIVGSLGALFQKKIKSFIAYSSIANIGYLILLSSGVYVIKASVILAIAIIFIVNYALILLQIFTNLIFNINIIGDKKKEIEYLSELSGAYKLNKVNSILIIVAFLSLIGIPPLIGFLIKFYIVTLFLINKLYWINLFYLFLGVVTAFYYLKIIKIIIFDNINKNLRLISTPIAKKLKQVQILWIQLLVFIKPLIIIIPIVIYMYWNGGNI